MNRTLGPLAVILLLVAVLAAACGGDDENSGEGSSGSPAVTATAPAEDEAAPEETATTEEPAAGEEDLDQAIEACKESVDTNPQVADDLKDDLKGVCDSVKSTNPEEMRRVTREVCEKIVEGSVPAGDIRNQALEACASAGG